MSNQTKKTQKQKFIMALLIQHSCSDMQTKKNYSITSNTKLIQSYQTNVEISYHKTNLSAYPGKF